MGGASLAHDNQDHDELEDSDEEQPVRYVRVYIELSVLNSSY